MVVIGRTVANLEDSKDYIFPLYSLINDIINIFLAQRTDICCCFSLAIIHINVINLLSEIDACNLCAS